VQLDLLGHDCLLEHEPILLGFVDLLDQSMQVGLHLLPHLFALALGRGKALSEPAVFFFEGAQFLAGSYSRRHL
jgi:hypothetical protein